MMRSSSPYMSSFRLRQVNRHVNRMPNRRIPPTLHIWPLTLRRRTMGRNSLSVWLLVGCMPWCSRNVNRCGAAEMILLASFSG